MIDSSYSKFVLSLVATRPVGSERGQCSYANDVCQLEWRQHKTWSDSCKKSLVLAHKFFDASLSVFSL